MSEKNEEQKDSDRIEVSAGSILTWIIHLGVIFGFLMGVLAGILVAHIFYSNLILPGYCPEYPECSESISSGVVGDSAPIPNPLIR